MNFGEDYYHAWPEEVTHLEYMLSKVISYTPSSEAV